MPVRTRDLYTRAPINAFAVGCPYMSGNTSGCNKSAKICSATSMDVPDAIPFRDVRRQEAGLNREEFEALFRHIAPGLLRYLTYLIGRDDADDVLTETMITLWGKNISSPGNADDLDRLTGLAFRVAQGHARNHVRSTTRRARLLGRLGLGVRESDFAEMSAEANLIAAEGSRTLLGRLKPDDQLLVALVADDFSSSEIAAILGISAAAVRMRLSRVRGAWPTDHESTHD